jgi:hypothetical protein
MDGDHGLSDLRFQGYSNERLAGQIDGLRGGAGAGSFETAARALIKLSTELTETDRVLRLQLGEIGVTWQGDAAEGGVAATKAASIYAGDAAPTVDASAKGVATQSGEFSHTRNSAPDSGALRGPTQANGWDRFLGSLGHTTDHANEVKQTNAARDQAVSGMNSYRSGSMDALGRAQTLPVPPGMNLTTPAATTGPGVSPVGFDGPRSGFGPGGTGVPGGGPGGFSELPGAPGPGAPFSGPGGPGAPGAPGVPGGPGGLPGQQTGVGPLGGPAVVPGSGPNTALPRGVPNPVFVAEAAALAGAGAGGAAAGDAAERDRLVRGKPGGQPPGGPEGKAKGASTLGSVPEDEARAVRNAERFGAKTGRGGGSPLMQPAAGSAKGEDDGEHVRRYGIDSGDVFEDERLIAPALIGEDDEPSKSVD